MLTGGIIKTYPKQNFSFILTPDKILIQTKYQIFYLEPKTHYWNRRINLIRTLIELDEIESLEHLASFCAGTNIMWINTSKNYYTDLQSCANVKV